MKRKISYCAVTWIQLSLTSDTTFCMLYKEGIYLYTGHNLLTADLDFVSSILKTSIESKGGKKRCAHHWERQSVDEQNACLACFVWYDFFASLIKLGKYLYQFNVNLGLCQTKCSLLEQHPVKVLLRSIIVSSFIWSIFIAMHNTSNRNYPNYLAFTHCAVCAFLCLRLWYQPVQSDLSISGPTFTCQVSSVAKSLLWCRFHLLVIHNNFLDVEIIAPVLTATSKKTTGNKHQIAMKRACN